MENNCRLYTPLLSRGEGYYSAAEETAFRMSFRQPAILLLTTLSHYHTGKSVLVSELLSALATLAAETGWQPTPENHLYRFIAVGGSQGIFRVKMIERARRFGLASV